MNNGWYLGFDASTPRLTIVLGRYSLNDEGELNSLIYVDGYQSENPASQASSEIVPRSVELAKRHDVALSDLTSLACGVGPGTFTGSRVAIATIMGIATGIQVPVFPISTLSAIAASANVDGDVLALIDARRSEVYAAVVSCSTIQADSGNHRVECNNDEQCCPLADYLAKQDTQSLAAIIGRPVELYGEVINSFVSVPGPGGPKLDAGCISTDGLWRVMCSEKRHSTPRDAGTLQATYLRESYAQMGLDRAKRPMKKSPFVD